MTQFELQIIGLILIAFILGAVIGYFLRTRIFPPVASAAERGGITLESRQERQPSSLLRGKGASSKGHSTAKSAPAKSAPAKSSTAQGATAKSSSGNKAGTGASSGKTSAANKKSEAKASKPAQTTPDNLQEIKGIGAVLEKKLNALGIERFDQIAGWTEGDIARVDETLNFRGRIEREQWVEQARELAKKSGG